MQWRMNHLRSGRRSCRPLRGPRLCQPFHHGDRYFKSLVAIRARDRILFGRRWRYQFRTCSGRLDGVRRIGIKGQSRLQFGGRAAAAGAIILKPGGDFTPPFGQDGQTSFGRSDNSTRSRRAPEAAQRGVAETAHIGRIAIHGAAMLTGFYHRSVLRCGRLAERKSGVVHILPARRGRKNICIDLSRIGYPRRLRLHPSQSMKFAEYSFCPVIPSGARNLSVIEYKPRRDSSLRSE